MIASLCLGLEGNRLEIMSPTDQSAVEDTRVARVGARWELGVVAFAAQLDVRLLSLCPV